jgi:hypothetical protein
MASVLGNKENLRASKVSRFRCGEQLRGTKCETPSAVDKCLVAQFLRNANRSCKLPFSDSTHHREFRSRHDNTHRSYWRGAGEWRFASFRSQVWRSLPPLMIGAARSILLPCDLKASLSQNDSPKTSTKKNSPTTKSNDTGSCAESGSARSCTVSQKTRISNYFKHYNRTKNGFIVQTWQRMVSASRRRGHQIGMTKDELRNFLLVENREKFDMLLAAWEASGFEKLKKPSIDQLDNSRGYSLDNIRLVTWKENLEASFTCPVVAEKKRANRPKHNKKKKTFCKRGHLFAETARIDKRGRRSCKICIAVLEKHYRSTRLIPNKFYNPEVLHEVS